MYNDLISYIDQIDDVCMESETNVLCQLAAVYTKSALMMQETELTTIVTESDKPKEAYVGSLGSRILDFLRTIWNGIVKLFKFILNKIKRFFQRLLPRYWISLIHSRNSEVKKVLEEAGFKVRVEPDGSWTVMVESINLKELNKAIKTTSEQMTIIHNALNAIREDNAAETRAQCAKINNSKTNAIRKVLDKKKIWVPYEELTSDMKNLDVTLDPLVKRAELISKTIQAIQKGKKKNDDMSYHDTLIEIQNISNELLRDVTKANEHYTRVITDIGKSQEDVRLKLDELLAKGFEDLRIHYHSDNFQDKLDAARNKDFANRTSREGARVVYDQYGKKHYYTPTYVNKEQEALNKEANRKVAALRRYVDDASRLTKQTPDLDPDRIQRDRYKEEREILTNDVQKRTKEIESLYARKNDLMDAHNQLGGATASLDEEIAREARNRLEANQREQENTERRIEQQEKQNKSDQRLIHQLDQEIRSPGVFASQKKWNRYKKKG